MPPGRGRQGGDPGPGTRLGAGRPGERGGGAPGREWGVEVIPGPGRDWGRGCEPDRGRGGAGGAPGRGSGDGGDPGSGTRLGAEMRAGPGAGRSRRSGESGAWCRGGATRARDRGERASGRDWGRSAEPGRGREEGPGWGRDPAAKRRPGAAESGMLAWAWWWGPRPGVVCTLGEPAAGAGSEGRVWGHWLGDEGTGARRPLLLRLLPPRPSLPGVLRFLAGACPPVPGSWGLGTLLVPAAS